MKRGNKLILAGAGLFVLGIALVPAVVAWLLMTSAPGDAARFEVPGTARVVVDVPGRYYLWNDFETEWRGDRYRASETVPESVEIAIWRVDTDEIHPFVPDTSISTRSGSEARNSLGYVEVDRPGALEILVAGVERRVFSFARTRIFALFRRLFGAIAVAVFLALGGAGLVIWGIVVSVQAPAVSAKVPTFRPEVLPPEDAAGDPASVAKQDEPRGPEPPGAAGPPAKR